MSSIRNILALTLFVIITCSRLEAQELAKLDESHLINEWHLFKRDTTGADYYDLTERRGPGITFKYNGDLVVDNGPICLVGMMSGMTQGANGFWRYKPETNTITAVLETDQGIINYEILDHGDSLLVLRPIW